MNLTADGFQATLRRIVHREGDSQRETHHARPIKTSRYDCAGFMASGLVSLKLGALDPDDMKAEATASSLQRIRGSRSTWLKCSTAIHRPSSVSRFPRMRLGDPR